VRQSGQIICKRLWHERNFESLELFSWGGAFGVDREAGDTKWSVCKIKTAEHFSY
jgi:hypothetical protein